MPRQADGPTPVSEPEEPGPPLPSRFFRRPARSVAADLVGCWLQDDRPEGSGLLVRLVETEAYVGPEDAAAHARFGRTPRTEPMFAAGGCTYVYLIYGLHYMLNIVTGPEGCGEAVLLRAAEAPDDPGRRLHGPGLLTRALQIDLEDSAKPLGAGGLVVLAGRRPDRVAVSPRVGVAYAGAWAAAPLRFFDPDSPAVSRGPPPVAADAGAGGSVG